MRKPTATIQQSRGDLWGEHRDRCVCGTTRLTRDREAIEDLTGGVTSEILSSNILDKDRFWREELMNVNSEFLFGCATGMFSNWLDPKYTGPPRDRKGISEGHSYSIMDAKEIDGVRLLRLR